jgi:hypothetical protein
MFRAILTPMREQRPHRARILVSERYGRHVRVAPRSQSHQPSVLVLRLAHPMKQHRSRSVNQQRSQVRVAALADTE